MAGCKTNAEYYFHFLPSFIIAKILFGFLFGYKKTGANVVFLQKEGGVMQAFEKRGIPVLKGYANMGG